jgi:hypothetical protein
MNRTPENEQGVAGLLELETIKEVYLHGHKHPELISPDNWNMDIRFMDRPSARRVQMDLFYDYRKNVGLYPQWQKFLRERQPKTLIFWGGAKRYFLHARRRRSVLEGSARCRDAPAGFWAFRRRRSFGDDCFQHEALLW